ncbi:hypothetical protein [Streptomyces sp. Ag109_O5-1]|uniref:hypothetical protein n=1 Tax=Streptomyces sp. Ag109_O5-1 TaxID=1938851 RepID=UPI0016295DDE|nr:hypothetical protein [Streptomyces sp. Ag109_O5-1]
MEGSEAARARLPQLRLDDEPLQHVRPLRPAAVGARGDEATAEYKDGVLTILVRTG